MPDIKSITLVFIGSGVGGVFRFVLSRFFAKYYPFFPFGTLSANLLGMFLIGLFAVWFIEKNLLQSPYREMVLVGFLGGLTTFSSFGHETYMLILDGRYTTVGLYFFGNLVIGFLLLFVGRYIGGL
ncbi:MAG: fluoride efflux transporter CrcB [Leptospiraceae bacterium]|nr:fluoride efflux transporter CrcB [Leptospiraceae bacterium]